MRNTALHFFSKTLYASCVWAILSVQDIKGVVLTELYQFPSLYIACSVLVSSTAIYILSIPVLNI
jgi:hypothetical protein